MYPDKFVNTAADLPDVEHWAVIRTDGVHIPGDERSRTNPGHGYPAEIRNFLSYQAYFTEEKLLQAIKKLEEPLYGGNRTEYKVIKVTPLKVEKELVLKLK
jgi:hypothetical protein